MPVIRQTRRIASGDYETCDGQFRIYRLIDVHPPAWNVERISDDRLMVDGAASKRDALWLLREQLTDRHIQIHSQRPRRSAA